jgi:Dolichyl-phosphate-mannose-protein mannosyltransferase
VSDESGDKSPRVGWRDGLILLIVVLACIGLRVTAMQPHLSFDEMWELGLSTGHGSPMGMLQPDVLHSSPPRFTDLDQARPVWRIWFGMDRVLHPPGFATTLRLWRELFGGSDAAAQSLSVFLSCVSVVCVFFAGRLALGPGLAGLAGLALACSQTLTHFGQEVRPYALMIAIMSVAVLLMTRIEILGPTRRRMIALALLTLPLMLTHYLNASACAAIAVFGIWRGGAYRKAFAAGILASAADYAFAWLPMAIRQLDDLQTGDAFLALADRDILRSIGAALSVPFRVLVDRDHFQEPFSLLAGVVLVMPVFLLRRSPTLRPWVIVACVLILGLLALDLIRKTNHLNFIRYVIIVAPVVPLLMIGTAAAIDRRLAWAVGLALPVMGLLNRGNPVLTDPSDFAQTRQVLEQRVGPGEAILFYPCNVSAWQGEGCMLAASHSKTLFPRPIVLLSGPPTPAILEALTGQRVWVVMAHGAAQEGILTGLEPRSAIGTEIGIAVIECLVKPR